MNSVSPGLAALLVVIPLVISLSRLKQLADDNPQLDVHPGHQSL